MRMIQKMGESLRDIFTNERENNLVQRVCNTGLFHKLNNEKSYTEEVGKQASSVFKVLNTIEISLDRLKLDKVQEILEAVNAKYKECENDVSLDSHGQRTLLALRRERLKTYIWFRDNADYNFEIFRNDISYLSHKQRSIEDQRRFSGYRGTSGGFM